MIAESALALRDRILAGDTSAADVCRDVFARIDAHDGSLHAFQSLMRERALARAEAIDRDPARFRAAALAGVPVALKDNIATRGHVTTAGSRVLDTFAPPYDAHAVERLDVAGAILIGKTTLDEFAMGSSTEHSAFGPARNPWSHDRTPGGSSGGSAAAVAAGFVPLALGSDTGGSIRQPAALCGVVGMKPTYGRVSRYGLFAFASSLDQIGPFARRVGDAAALLEVISGPDPRDMTSSDAAPVAWNADTPMRPRTRIGVPRAELGAGVDGEVLAAFERALEVLRRRGAVIADVELPSSGAAIAAYYLIATAEASSNLARYDGVRFGARVTAPALDAMYTRTRTAGFGDEVKRRIMLGTYALSAGYHDAYYLRALKVRQAIRDAFARAFASVDLIAMPTSPTPAFALGERVSDPVRMYAADVFTVGASLAGLPAISVPCGFSSGPPPLPIGLQLIGRPWDEAGVLTAAGTYETSTEWWRTSPAPA
ncbi:MAG TPA: Asp-tRNA(Asn)/Glu-tRNA(Gln) amidotransferase subunit GatA [Vicinamibacterales bacterium]|nr:Asp-tRNA(Asn)/Glu-tRNA(Gln) amidotransferase subunit GatA [Vicinamibacterales bacterium]